MTRLKDIALAAGVSLMTVSKALRGEPDVSAATRAKVKSLALQLGYVPNSSAQGLRTKTTRLFGLLIPATTNPVYARMVFAIEERAHDLGYDVIIAQSLNQPEREDACLRRMLSRRVDGLLIMNALKVTAAPCAMPDWNRMTSLSSRPATPSRMAPRPPSRCSMKAASPPPS